MKIEYGPPGHKGVTTLMAVGDDGEPTSSTDRAVIAGQLLSIGVWVAGSLTSNRAMRHAGFGASVALLAVRLWSQRSRMIPVTQPAPEPTGRCYPYHCPY